MHTPDPAKPLERAEKELSANKREVSKQKPGLPRHTKAEVFPTGKGFAPRGPEEDLDLLRANTFALKPKQLRLPGAF